MTNWEVTLRALISGRLHIHLLILMRRRSIGVEMKTVAIASTHEL